MRLGVYMRWAFGPFRVILSLFSINLGGGKRRRGKGNNKGGDFV